MQASFDLRNAIVTQKSKREILIYDKIQQGIDEAIKTLKDRQKNAIVRNIIYDIQGQTVVLQLFINRVNGFVPTEEARFGTSPTAYHIQLRFVHGFEAALGQEPVFIANGRFSWDNLAPRLIQDHIIDDIYHEMQLIGGKEIVISDREQELTIKSSHFPRLSLPTWREEGKGYETFTMGKAVTPNTPKYYFNQTDYDQRHKLNAVYALTYLQPEDPDIFRTHPEYRGYTVARAGIYEPQDAQAPARYQEYQNWTQAMSNALQQHPVTHIWARNHNRSATEAQPYRLDILSINGIHLYTDSGLMVDRLYDYQVELMQLFTQVYQEIRANNVPNQLPTRVHASVVDMGVGAGKTYIINSVLKYLSRFYTDANYAPAFCMTPDAALASVMERVVNRQDGLAQVRSHAITQASDIPSTAFLQQYQDYAQIAVQETTQIRNYINGGLQQTVLEYCREHGLHPFVIMNALYDAPEKCRTYQNSVDIKRLLLLIEGQKLIMEKTGLSPLIALRRLYDELEKIIVAVDKEQNDHRSLFHHIQNAIQPSYPATGRQVSYDREVPLPNSVCTANLSQINFKHITAALLKTILEQKYSYKPSLLQKSVAIRDVLLKIACLSDVKAAILLANGGGLANTHTQEELTAQIAALLEPAARELRRGAERDTPMTYLEHRTYFLYLNEIFATIPAAINSKLSYNYDDPALLQTALRYNYQLLHSLRTQIGQQLAQLSHVQRGSRVTIIETVDHMAGQVGLLLTGKVARDGAKLLSTHVPIFTPEGWVAYLEALVAREGQADVTITYQQGVYLTRTGGRVSRLAVQQRLMQVFSAVMLADEIHKEAYQFFYEPTHPLYQRVNRITQDYFNQEFSEILPHRVGMSGTVNQIARRVFGQHTLYALPLQDMIQRQLTKEIAITTLTHNNGDNVSKDYFTRFNAKNSKGILFSKQAYLYPDVDPYDVDRDAHMRALQDQLMVHYLEFVLQKSGAPKELSEIVSLQNKLYAKRTSLIGAFLEERDDDEDLQDVIRSLRHVSPELISETDVQNYVKRSLHDPELQALLAQTILRFKTQYKEVARALTEVNVILSPYVTRDPKQFEDGLSQVLIGTEAQQTGYSHEFVGTIVDTSYLALMQNFDSMLLNKTFAPFSGDQREHYNYLQQLLDHSFSYDEKNQIAGRALRTASGTASYLEYMSPNYDRNAELNIETSFNDILIENKALAVGYRNSVMFNRLMLSLLRDFEGSFTEWVDHVVAYCQEHDLLNAYQPFIETRLPNWWAIKFESALRDFTELQGIADRKLRDLAIRPQPQVFQTNAGWVDRSNRQHSVMDNQDHNNAPNNPPLAFNLSLWLTWMTQPRSMIVGGIIVLAGLALLACTSVPVMATALVMNSAKALVVAGSVLFLASASRSLFAFFQRGPGGGGDQTEIVHRPSGYFC